MQVRTNGNYSFVFWNPRGCETAVECLAEIHEYTKYTTVLLPDFLQMENIELFLVYCQSYGVPKTSLFQTVDLYEGRNMAQVLSCLQALGSEVGPLRSTCTSCAATPLKNQRNADLASLTAHSLISTTFIEILVSSLPSPSRCS